MFSRFNDKIIDTRILTPHDLYEGILKSEQASHRRESETHPYTRNAKPRIIVVHPATKAITAEDGPSLIIEDDQSFFLLNEFQLASGKSVYKRKQTATGKQKSIPPPYKQWTPP